MTITPADVPLFCKFCNNAARYVPLKILLKSRSVGPTTMAWDSAHDLGKYMQVHFCDICQAEYSPLMHSLYVVIKDSTYRWSVYAPFQHAVLSFIGKPGIPGEKANEDIDEVMVFDEDIPIITPDNIKEKVALMLTFM
jgi:hypothetical protein